MKDTNNLIKKDNRPLYDQAIVALNKLIEENGYKPGDRLPAEGELAKRFGISRATLREAVGSLEAQGTIERRHGVGTFVTAPPQGGIHSGLEFLVSLHNMALNAGVNAVRKDWIVSSFKIIPELEDILEVTSDENILRVIMTMKADNRYFAFFDSFIPAKYVNNHELECFNDGSLLDFLIKKGEPRLTYTNTNVYAIEAVDDVAKWLNVYKGRPLLLLEETMYSDNGVAIIFTRNHFVTDNLNFHIVRRIEK